jgi:hypothetical protein
MTPRSCRKTVCAFEAEILSTLGGLWNFHAPGSMPSAKPLAGSARAAARSQEPPGRARTASYDLPWPGGPSEVCRRTCPPAGRTGQSRDEHRFYGPLITWQSAIIKGLQPERAVGVAGTEALALEQRLIRGVRAEVAHMRGDGQSASNPLSIAR